MARLQAYFRQFHETIKLNNLDENRILRKKRDIVLDKLRLRLKTFFQDKNEPIPTFDFFNQGSYAMGTGIQPLEGDYDIDVGLKFHISKEDYFDPVQVKQWVYDALYGHTQRVECRKPCVTVFYQRHDEPIYHVDLAIYSEYDYQGGRLYLAKGKLHSQCKERIWEPSEPQKLIERVKNQFGETEDREQFRRVIRYLKRWKDVQFSETASGKAAPIGIGLTVAAYHWFNVSKSVDVFTGKFAYDDASALKVFVKTLIGRFRNVYSDSGERTQRLCVDLPVAPYCDLFEKMTDNQMTYFHKKLERLLETLQEAEYESEFEACQQLQKKFGRYFPLPE